MDLPLEKDTHRHACMQLTHTQTNAETCACLCTHAYKYTHPSIFYLSINLSINICIYPSIYLSIYISTFLSLFITVYLFILLFPSINNTNLDKRHQLTINNKTSITKYWIQQTGYWIRDSQIGAELAL